MSLDRLYFPSNQEYYNDSDSRLWMLYTHGDDLSAYQQTLVSESSSAFIIYGGEEYPSRIEIFSSNAPAYGEIPMFILERDDDGDLVVTPPIPGGSVRPFYISPSTIGY